MGKPISMVAPAIQQAPTQVAPSKGGDVTQSEPPQQEAPSLWPPAYGFRLGAVQGRHGEGHNSWQRDWIGGQMEVAAGSESVHDVKAAIADLLEGPGRGKGHGRGGR